MTITIRVTELELDLLKKEKKNRLAKIQLKFLKVLSILQELTRLLLII